VVNALAADHQRAGRKLDEDLRFRVDEVPTLWHESESVQDVAKFSRRHWALLDEVEVIGNVPPFRPDGDARAAGERDRHAGVL
jgi:hypothetical protein